MKDPTKEIGREATYGVRAVQRALDLLDALQEAPDGLTLAQLADAAALPKSSIFRYLATLEARGYVERDGGRGRFRIAARLTADSPRFERLADTARPHLHALRDRFQETVNLGVLEGARIAYLEILESPLAVRFAARPGVRDPLHSTALGKAIAAQLPAANVRRLLAAQRLAPRTSRTITDAASFLRELARVRERGFAIDDGENEEDGRCVAVALPGTSPPAAISLSAPTVRFSLERAEDVATALRRTADQLGRELALADA
jgi:IclR family acetate operon transcriptional repressor